MTGLLGSSKEDEGGEMMEERPAESTSESPQEMSQSESDIGISSLMNKRANVGGLEEKSY